MPGPSLVCLLPVKDGAAQLPAWFECVEKFADAVVALDDGSTDDTRAVLRSNPLVTTVLTNPIREGFAGWDDAANRQRLLEAASRMAPTWIMSLDADERIDSEDSHALRAFVEKTPAGEHAYLFRVHRMIGDMQTWDRADMWAGRLFPFHPDQRFPADRLHFVPIPASIPRENWLKSTVRIQHCAGLTGLHRSRRFAKYQEVDPDLRYQASYDHILDEPTRVQPWEPRPPSLPFVLHGTPGPDVPPAHPDHPELSAVVISRDDEDRIARSVGSVVAQETSAPIEVIVVVSGSDSTADIVRARYPEVTLVVLDTPALPGAARNAGLAVARGRYVSFPGSHVVLPRGSLEARIQAHRLGYAMVTGTMRNGTDTRAGWASYFLDHSTTLAGRPSMPLTIFPAHCSYRRAALEHVGGFPDIRSGEDTLVNQRLFELGYGAFRSRDIELAHHTRAETPGLLLRHHVLRGSGLTQLLLEANKRGEVLNRAGLRRYVVVWLPGRLRRIHRNVYRWGDRALRRRYYRSVPLIAAAATAHWLAGWWGFLKALQVQRASD